MRLNTPGAAKRGARWRSKRVTGTIVSAPDHRSRARRRCCSPPDRQTPTWPGLRAGGRVGRPAPRRPPAQPSSADPDEYRARGSIEQPVSKHFREPERHQDPSRPLEACHGGGVDWSRWATPSSEIDEHAETITKAVDCSADTRAAPARAESQSSAGAETVNVSRRPAARRSHFHKRGQPRRSTRAGGDKSRTPRPRVRMSAGLLGISSPCASRGALGRSLARPTVLHPWAYDGKLAAKALESITVAVERSDSEEGSTWSAISLRRWRTLSRRHSGRSASAVRRSTARIVQLPRSTSRRTHAPARIDLTRVRIQAARGAVGVDDDALEDPLTAIRARRPRRQPRVERGFVLHREVGDRRQADRVRGE